MIVRESLEFKRGRDSKESMEVGIKEINRDLVNLAINMFNDFPDIGFTRDYHIRRRQGRLSNVGTDKFPIFFHFTIDTADLDLFEKMRKLGVFKKWARENTPYQIVFQQKGGANVNPQTSSGRQTSYTFYLDDK